uniref:Pyrin domain-containing protein n=1 Tax=Pelusios castaneus TaxID=367368 RepID=A0A8C8RHF6_9SAUR
MGYKSRIGVLLLNALDNLKEEELKRFKDQLSVSDFKGKRNIPRGQLQHADTIDTKNLLLEHYGVDDAVDITIDVFTRINLNQSAAILGEERKKGKKPKASIKPGNFSQTAVTCCGWYIELRI